MRLAARVLRLGFVAILVLLGVGERALAATGAADVYVARAIVAYEEKRFDDALEELDAAIELDAENVDAWFYTGLVRVARGELDEAEKAFERARTISPEDPSILYQLGALHYRQGRDERARPLLEDAFARKPTLDGLGFYVGVLRYRAGDYDAALVAFGRAQTADPDLAQLGRFYAGLASLRLGLADRAGREIDEALRLRPASPLTGPSERLRELAVAMRERDRRVHVELRAAGFYDDNVPVQPQTSDDPAATALRSGDRDSLGALTALRVDALLLRREAFEGVASYSFFSTNNADLPEFDILDNLLELGGAYRGTAGRFPYELAVRYGYEFVTLALDEFVQRHAISPTLTVAESLRHMTAFQLQFRSDDFADDDEVVDDDQRSGFNYLAGFVHLVRFGKDRHILKLGYQFDLDDTDGRNFRYVGHRVLAGAQTLLPRVDVRLGYDFDVHFRDYRTNTTFPLDNPGTEERSDTELTHTVWVTRALPRGFTVFLVGQFGDASSNLDVFDFQRNVVTAGLGWFY